MAKGKFYICENCGQDFLQWSGKCPACGEWNTFKEVQNFTSKTPNLVREEPVFLSLEQYKRLPLARIESLEAVDEILGGGIVPGSTIVLGGTPGVGKSTLALSIASKISEVVYVAGEESVSQIALRVQRFSSQGFSHILFTETTDVISLVKYLNKKPPKLLIVDSVQTLYNPEFPSTPGSLVQVRESALVLQRFAKKNQTAVLMIGHVTKVGEIAGPRILEHLVDVVLYLEGEKESNARLLRASKNRFGPTGEVAVFEMTEKGLHAAKDPSFIFLEGRKTSVGRTLSCVFEGQRPFLIEVEALVSKTSFSLPRRTAAGYDLSRLYTLVAVLEERCGMRLTDKDIFLNIVGGFATKDRSLDAAVCLSIVSALLEKAPPAELCVFGEVDLLAEVRKPLFYKKRIEAIKKLGFQPYLPKSLKELFKYCFG
jgi:DNA repair protein RadA/Sms